MKLGLKNYVFVLSLLLFTGCAGMYPVEKGTSLQKIIEVDNMTKDEIFLKTIEMQWFTADYKTFNNSGSGYAGDKIIGNGEISHFYNFKGGGAVKFSVIIELKELKEGRVRISLSNFSSYIGGMGSGQAGNLIQGEYDRALPNLNRLMDDYAVYIKSPPIYNDDDSW